MYINPCIFVAPYLAVVQSEVFVLITRGLYCVSMATSGSNQRRRCLNGYANRKYSEWAGG